ncbi:MAG: phosphoenolpyruvate--protein phosphotransferase [Verrucomicrobia bacterium]|jgi:phosphotransferase system enzyme I (PtsI)|nr:phosphoenolpyruvate--protein phosphotransferase [Verrucomicrobiota bacterium]
MASSNGYRETIFHGIAVSAGVARARIRVLSRTQLAVGRQPIPPEEAPREIQRLEKALVDVRREIQEVQSRVSADMGAEHAAIFDAHLLVLEDPVILDEVTRLIQTENLNAEYAYQQVVERYAASLAKLGDAYLRERVSDIEDVSTRVLHNLVGHKAGDELRNLEGPCIVVAHDLAPSMTAHLDPAKVVGFATDAGSRTSHTAILARSLQIPAVVGLGSITDAVESGIEALLDGYEGLVIVHPSEETLYRYGQLAARREPLLIQIRKAMAEPAITLDGRRITVSGNIEEPRDVESVSANGAEGVGLFRTEYLFIDRDAFPSEDEQYESYRQVAATLKPDPVIIRTLDLGGDKFQHPTVPKDKNPFLGWRAIRFCLHEKDVFRAQLRAILRASAHGNIKMMYPMISGLEELRQANELLDECKGQLRAEGKPFNDQMEVGAMVETPSAAMISDSLARRLKFLSIGTNDLIQYCLAVDRTNDKIAHLYEPTHPGILRLIHGSVAAAHQHGIWVGVCGEMAGDMVLVPLLLGLGVDELSAAPPVVPQIKYLIRRLNLSAARELAEFALASESGGDVLERCLEFVNEVAPGLLEQGPRIDLALP